MKKSTNESYNRIIEYIGEHDDLDPEKKRMLFHYASQLLLNNIENTTDEPIEAILSGLKKLNENLRTANDTSIVAQRLEDEIKLFQLITKYYQGELEYKSEIVYLLDKLYLDTDMGIRESSSLAYSLTNQKNRRK